MILAQIVLLPLPLIQFKHRDTSTPETCWAISSFALSCCCCSIVVLVIIIIIDDDDAVLVVASMYLCLPTNFFFFLQGHIQENDKCQQNKQQKTHRGCVPIGKRVMRLVSTAMHPNDPRQTLVIKGATCLSPI